MLSGAGNAVNALRAARYGIDNALGRTDTLVCPCHNPATTRADRQECLSYKNLNQLPELVTLCSNDFHMLAAVTRQGRVALVQKPQPRLGPGWALVRVRLAGICSPPCHLWDSSRIAA